MLVGREVYTLEEWEPFRRRAALISAGVKAVLNGHRAVAKIRYDLTNNTMGRYPRFTHVWFAELHDGRMIEFRVATMLPPPAASGNVVVDVNMALEDESVIQAGLDQIKQALDRETQEVAG